MGLVGEKTVRFQGEITAKKVEQVQRLFESSQADLLLISSPGGDGLAAMTLGKFLFDEGITLQVRDVCSSACANYLFLAAPKKVLEVDSLVVFHGGVRQSNFEQQLVKLVTPPETADAAVRALQPGKEAIAHSRVTEQTKPEFVLTPCHYQPKMAKSNPERAAKQAKRCSAYLAKKELDFFNHIGVDPYIPYYGQLGAYKSIYQSYQYQGFYYSPAALEELGVRGIHLSDKRWAPEQNLRAKRYYQVELKKIKLHRPQ